MTAASLFAIPGSQDEVETGTSLAPRFDAHGLITAIATDVASGEVVMVAHMNEAALAKTIATREAWFWSRSRKELWRKGLTSGNTLEVVELRVDCDQDAVLLKVRIAGDQVACHQGYRSCFYRTVPLGAAPSAETKLAFDDTMPRVVPKA